MMPKGGGRFGLVWRLTLVAWAGLLAVATLLGACSTGKLGGAGSQESDELSQAWSDTPLPPPIIGAGGPGEPPETAVQGIFDCPTVDRPSYSFAEQVDAPLSEPFGRICASCHGADGRGRAQYPPIPGQLSLKEFMAVVRDGEGEGMPAFAPQSVSDAELEQDFEALRALQEQGEMAQSSFDEWTWSDEQVQQAYDQGLVAWRKPDPHGVACANCHTPDAIDLAILGYEDHDILRRARLHLQPGDAAAVVNFVHAQRRRFNIARPCSPTYRPFQPGGEVLPGGEQERELAFAAQLEERELTMIVGQVVTLQDARQAFEQLRQVDLKRLPVGIALPRWTEDGFNADEHRSLNDYIAPLGSLPKDPEGWYGLEDAYIADPTDARLVEMLERLASETHDGGYYEQFSGREEGRACPEYKQVGDYLRIMNEGKRGSALLAQHWFRKALRGEPGWYELPMSPYQDQGWSSNPFDLIGGENVETPCYRKHPHSDAVIESFPDDVFDELTTADQQSMDLGETSDQLFHPWMTLAQLYDPALNDRSRAGSVKYWHIGFAEKQIHEPFFMAHRMASRTHVYEEAIESANVHPLLDGVDIEPGALDAYIKPDSELAPANLLLKGNTVRAILLIQRQLLLGGAAVRDKKYGGEPGIELADEFDKFRSLAGRIEDYLTRKTGTALTERLGDPDLYTTELRALIDEVEALVEAAPTVE